MAGFLGNMWESFQGMPHVQQASPLSPQQQALLGPLVNFYGSQLGQPNQGQSDINDLLGGNSPLANAFTNNAFQSLLGPSMRDFQQSIVPSINSNYAGMNGIFNTRRMHEIAQTGGNIIQNAQNQTAQQIPGFYNLISSMIGQRTAQQYTPAQMAQQFALQPTQQNFFDSRVGSLWQGGDAYMNSLGKMGGMMTGAGI